jgi:hypothetical protein
MNSIKENRLAFSNAFVIQDDDSDDELPRMTNAPNVVTFANHHNMTKIVGESKDSPDNVSKYTNAEPVVYKHVSKKIKEENEKKSFTVMESDFPSLNAPLSKVTLSVSVTGNLLLSRWMDGQETTVRNEDDSTNTIVPKKIMPPVFKQRKQIATFNEKIDIIYDDIDNDDDDNFDAQSEDEEIIDEEIIDELGNNKGYKHGLY